MGLDTSYVYHANYSQDLFHITRVGNLTQDKDEEVDLSYKYPCAYPFCYPGLNMYILMLLILYSLIGCLGNGNIIFRFFRHPELHSVYNVFILNMAIGDLISIIFFAVLCLLAVYGLTSPNEVIVACRLLRILLYAAGVGTSFTVPLLSYYHLEVVRNITSGKQHNSGIHYNYWAIYSIIWLWIFMTLFSARIILGSSTGYVCSDSLTYNIYDAMLIVLLCIAIPILAPVVYYGLIIKILVKYENTNKNEALHQNKKLMVGTAILLIFVILLRIPLLVLFIIQYFKGIYHIVESYTHYIMLFAVYSGCLDVSIKPIILHFTNKDYVFCCCIKRNEKSNNKFELFGPVDDSDCGPDLDREIRQTEGDVALCE